MDKKQEKVLSTMENLNILVDFLTKRNIDKLTAKALEEKYKISQVDLLILFGGCIPESCEVFYTVYDMKIILLKII